MQSLSPFLKALIAAQPQHGGARANSGGAREGAGRKPNPDTQANVERVKAYKKRKQKEKHSKLAVLDFETDPFDNLTEDKIFPFLAVLYPADLPHVVIWDDDKDTFTTKVVQAIEALPDSYYIYAHNGGRFDFYFLLKHLRGEVKFKGRALMSAMIGNHHLRDSFHIIPERLANYKKDHFDYTQLKRCNRHKIREEAIKYCVADCAYLLDIVTHFVQNNGLKISIGQAAMASLKGEYSDVGRLGRGMDAYCRKYFFGGRVECLLGPGLWEGDFKLYDVNSMYPYAMANRSHPIGGDDDFYFRKGSPGAHTVFLEIDCDSYGALVTRTKEGETLAPYGRGRFMTTIWEYETALRLGLIENVKFITMVDCHRRSDFSRWINPLYALRMETKKQMGELEAAGKKNTPEYDEIKKQNILIKLFLNNAYGKFAQNPERFKECYITEVNEKPPEDKNSRKIRADKQEVNWFRSLETDDYWLWERPCPSVRFNNVATAASITGAARAILLEALHAARNPIYCDTDSIICEDLKASETIVIDKEALGAWDIEARIEKIIVVGKKQYSYFKKGEQAEVIKTKGVSGKVIVRDPETHKEIERRHLAFKDFLAMLRGEIVEVIQNAPTIGKGGDQQYMRRRIRTTSSERNLPNGIFRQQPASPRLARGGRSGQGK